MKTIKKGSNKTKTKILIKVDYKDYLKSEIAQVIHKGEIIHDRDCQLEVIKKVDQDLYQVVKLSGVNVLGESTHFKANSKYFAQLTVEQLGKKIYTSEEHHEKLKGLKSELNHHNVFKLIDSNCGYVNIPTLQKYLNENDDLFKYKDFSNSFIHWGSVLSNCSQNRFAFKKVREALRDFFNKLDEYRNLKNKYQYKNLPSKIVLWTPEKLSGHLGCRVNGLYPVLCSNHEDFEKGIDKLIDECMINRSELVKHLLNKFEISY